MVTLGREGDPRAVRERKLREGYFGGHCLKSKPGLAEREVPGRFSESLELQGEDIFFRKREGG